MDYKVKSFLQSLVLIVNNVCFIELKVESLKVEKLKVEG